MKNSTKTTLIVIAILLIPIGLGAYLFLRKKNTTDPTDTPDESGVSVAGSDSSQISILPNQSFPLRKNSSVKSNLVKGLQELLNERIKGLVPPAVPYYAGQQIKSLTTDGYYGDKTAAVVKYVFCNDGNSVTQEQYDSLKNPSLTYSLYI